MTYYFWLSREAIKFHLSEYLDEMRKAVAEQKEREVGMWEQEWGV